MAVRGRIKNIEEWAVHDGPGLRCIVFLKGCALRCSWCQNPELIDPHPEIWFRKLLCVECETCVQVCEPGAITMDKDNKFDPEKCDRCFKCVEVCRRECFQKMGTDITSEEVVNILLKFRQYYDESGGGVTISGGEPLFQPDFSADILRRCKELDIGTTIESCLYAGYDTVTKVVSQCTGLLCDLKHMDSEKHRAGTGVPNELILDNLKRLNKDFAGDIHIRIPLIPGYNDDLENVKKSIEFLYPLEKVKGVDLLPFNFLPIGKYDALNKPWVFQGVDQQPEEYLQQLQAIVDSYDRFKTTVGGLW